MTELTPYLNFDGDCRQAMEFYRDSLGAELHMQSFGDSPVPSDEGTKNRIMHARLTKGAVSLMASDTMPGTPLNKGNNAFLCINCENREEIERLFSLLGAGGKTLMPLQDTFWGARFGMLTDRFGVQWMFNLQLEQTHS